MLALDLGSELEGLLDQMSAQTGRPVADIARAAIVEALEDWEDIIAVEAALKEGGEYLSLEEVEAMIEGDSSHGSRSKPAAE